ncbi:MAG: hypothetical protein ABSH22_06505 [Tepidisphaeraceae bacterium]|jgi:hypothetical protein
MATRRNSKALYADQGAANRRALRQTLRGQTSHEDSLEQAHAGTRSEFSDQPQCGHTFSFYEGASYEGSDFVGPDHEGAD